MKNDILNNYKSKVINFIKKFYIKNDLSRNYVLFGFFIILVISAIFSYSSNLKKKRLKAVDSFISSNETILLKNYLLNQIKSPYFEYDYIVKNNDTVESILKKFSVKKKEISFIVREIKKRKLSNITPNQKVKFVLRRSSDKTDMEVLKIEYPISKTTYVNIDKVKDGLDITASYSCSNDPVQVLDTSIEDVLLDSGYDVDQNFIFPKNSSSFIDLKLI